MRFLVCCANADMLQALSSVAINGEFSPLWELLGAEREKKLWGIPHQYLGEF